MVTAVHDHRRRVAFRIPERRKVGGVVWTNLDGTGTQETQDGGHFPTKILIGFLLHAKWLHRWT